MVNALRLQQSRPGLAHATQYQPVANQEKADTEKNVTQTALIKNQSNAITQTIDWIKNNPTKVFLGSLFVLGGMKAISGYAHSMTNNNQLSSTTNLTNTDLNSLFIERLINNTQYEQKQNQISKNSNNKIVIDTFDPPDNQGINDKQNYNLTEAAQIAAASFDQAHPNITFPKGLSPAQTLEYLRENGINPMELLSHLPENVTL